MNIIEGLMEQTRMVTGATEVMTGEVIGAGMSGAAIATLQAQALKPIEEKQKMFWRYKQRQGMIMAEFFKHYYEGRPFTFTKKDSKGKEKLEAAVFNGSDYVNTDFRVIVQAGAAAAFSESGDIAMLESLVQKRFNIRQDNDRRLSRQCFIEQEANQGSVRSSRARASRATNDDDRNITSADGKSGRNHQGAIGNGRESNDTRSRESTFKERNNRVRR